MDLYINDVNNYGLCLNKENKDGITECHTPIIEQKDDHIIKIKNGRKNGNTQLTVFLNDFIINQNSIIAISKAYDLQFKNNNWEFKIKTANIIKLNEIKKLVITIDNSPSTANCEGSSDFILCKVNKDSQSDTQ